MSDPVCVRAGIEMTKSQWMSVPVEVRARYCKETDWGTKKIWSAEIEKTIRRCVKGSASWESMKQDMSA